MSPESGDYITIVSGLPRSGTSMMMRMLAAGGMEVLTSASRRPDEDNPNGYYELDRVKQLHRDTAWLFEAKGKALKAVYVLLYQLPPTFTYRVIFMLRRLEEVVASQETMLRRQQKEGAALEQAQLLKAFEQHLRRVEEWAAQQVNLDVLCVDYNDVVGNPHPSIQMINEFLDCRLDTTPMAAVVDPALYRQRGTGDSRMNVLR